MSMLDDRQKLLDANLVNLKVPKADFSKEVPQSTPTAFDPSSEEIRFCSVKTIEKDGFSKLNDFLDKREYSSARKQYAELMRYGFSQEGYEKFWDDLEKNPPPGKSGMGTFGRYNRSAADSLKLRDAFNEFPPAERPLPLDDTALHDAVRVGRMFGEEVEAMTVGEFKKFAEGVATTVFVTDSKFPKDKQGRPTGVDGASIDAPYVSRVMDDINLPKKDQDEIMAKAVETRRHYLEQKKYDHESDWPDRYYLEDCLMRIALNSTAQGISFLVKYIDSHSTGQKMDREAADHVDVALSNLTRSIDYARLQTTGQNSETIPELKRNIALINKWKDSPVFKADPYVRRHLLELLDALK